MPPVVAIPWTATPSRTRRGSSRSSEQLQPDPPLYPSDDAACRRALELEEFFDEELGPHIRRAWFFLLLPETDFFASVMARGPGATTQRIYRAVFPVIRELMKLDMGINAASADRSRAKLGAALDRIEAELQPSGCLVGDRFSVADLTAAALLFPIVSPPEFPYALPSPLPAAAARFRDAFGGRRAFQWAAEMYRRHRGASAEVAA